MRQYLDAKRQYPEAIVFFRMGDFYEMFYEDALVASRALDLTLTSRAKDADGGSIPMCGLPYHAAEGYLTRLVKKGFRVAICEQVEDPRKAKGLVRREVVRVISPGTLTESGYLDARESAYLIALAPSPFTPPAATHLQSGGLSRFTPRDPTLVIGAALLDLSTGEFQAAEYRGPDGLQALADEMAVLRPREIVVPDDVALDALVPASARAEASITRVDAWTFESDSARRTLLGQFHTHSLEGYGLEDRLYAVRAAGGLVKYLQDTQKAELTHVRSVTFREQADRLAVDPLTIKHLEIVESFGGTRAGSLLHELDRSVTPMGARLLKSWLLGPLVSLERIRDRLTDRIDRFDRLARSGAGRAIRQHRRAGGEHPVERRRRVRAKHDQRARDHASCRLRVSLRRSVRRRQDEQAGRLREPARAGGKRHGQAARSGQHGRVRARQHRELQAAARVVSGQPRLMEQPVLHPQHRVRAPDA